MRQKSFSPSMSESLDRRLAAYALAASAAGVGMIIWAPPAECEIVYKKVHEVIARDQNYRLDLNGDRTTDFTLKNFRHSGSFSGFAAISAIPVAGNGVVGFRSPFQVGWAIALKSGSRIGSGRYFNGKRMATTFSTEGGDYGSDGSWLNVQKRYLGLKFKIGKDTHFGWARLNVDAHLGLSATLTGYAYETVPRKPIKAGQTQESVDESNESSDHASRESSMIDAPATMPSASLGRLARGSARNGSRP